MTIPDTARPTVTLRSGLALAPMRCMASALASVAAARAVLKLSGPIRVGRNTWYFAPNGKSNAIFKVRAGIIEEIGVAQKSLTGTTKAKKTFLTSFS